METVLLVPTFMLYNLIHSNVVTCVETEGQSMEPTIYETNILFVDRFIYKYLRGLKKGDVILAQSPVEKNVSICKRVVAQENDNVDVKTGRSSYAHQTFTVPENHVWVEGDNKDKSFDSRHHGPIPKDLITGRVLFSIYPLKSV